MRNYMDIYGRSLSQKTVHRGEIQESSQAFQGELPEDHLRDVPLPINFGEGVSNAAPVGLGAIGARHAIQVHAGLTQVERLRTVVTDDQTQDLRSGRRSRPDAARGGGLPGARCGASASDGVLRAVDLRPRSSEADLLLYHGSHRQFAIDAGAARLTHGAILCDGRGRALRGAECRRFQFSRRG
jgi:hypothetical protein